MCHCIFPGNVKGADITKMKLSEMAPEIVLSFYIVQFVIFSMFQHHTQFLGVCVAHLEAAS